MKQVEITEATVNYAIVRLCGCNYRLERKLKKQIRTLRKEGLPLLIVKKDGITYAGTIYGMRFYSNAGHLCCKGGVTCERLCSKTDEEGGCKKVRQNSRGIETCDFITDGFEAVHTEKRCDCLVVKKCKNFQQAERDKKISPKRMETDMLALMQEIVPDILTHDELKRRISKNEERQEEN